MHLIANRWYVVCEPSEIPRRKPLRLQRLGQDLVLWRDATGEIAAAIDRCPHRHARLSPGRVVEGRIECPFHGLQFRRSGACVVVPAHPERATRPALALCSLPTRCEHGFLWIFTGPEEPPDEPIPFFDFSGFRWTGSGFIEPVRTHYSRAIENQLDFPHLPFVHRNTIGRFVDEEMEVHTEVEGDHIRAHIGNDTILDFIGPCCWRLRAGPGWQFLAFVPVDDHRMLYYVRGYQSLVRLPGLDWLAGRIGAWMNRIVLRQDSPVVESQPAVETRYKMGEMLLPSDRPILAYRRWREEHRAAFDPLSRGRPSI